MNPDTYSPGWERLSGTEHGNERGGTSSGPCQEDEGPVTVSISEVPWTKGWSRLVSASGFRENAFCDDPNKETEGSRPRAQQSCCENEAACVFPELPSTPSERQESETTNVHHRQRGRVKGATAEGADARHAVDHAKLQTACLCTAGVKSQVRMGLTGPARIRSDQRCWLAGERDPEAVSRGEREIS